MKKSLLFFLITGFSFKSFSQDSANNFYTLKQCVETAIANNADVKNFQFQMLSNKVTWQQAKGNMLPFISGNISHGINQGRSIDPFTNGYINQSVNFADYSLSASINLWNGLSIQNNIKSNSLNYQASQMDLQQEKDNITINVILAYLQVLSNTELLKQAMQQAEVTRKQAERLTVLNNEGAIAPATLYDMKGQLGNDELNVVNAKNSLETAKLTLAQLMNIAYSSSMQLENISGNEPSSIYEATPEQIFQQASQQLAIVKAADLRKLSTNKAVKSAHGQLLPSLFLNGGLFTNYSSAATLSQLINTTDVATDNYILLNNDKFAVYAPQNNYSSQKISYGNQWKNNFNSSVSIGLQIPLLNGLQAKSRVSQAKINEEKAIFQSSTVRIQLKQSIEQAYVNMTAAYERYQTLTSQVQDFTQSFRAAEVRFNEGALTSVDYMIAKNNVDRANINLISAKYDYILRTKILDYYKGKLLL
ncbi:MAG: TolC family protein [Chitinophagaceae bacterium]